MKIVFMGTPEFAVPSLKNLVNNFKVEAVFTQPDRPRGRGQKLSISPVKEEALKYNIPVYQPNKIKKDMESINVLKKINPDFIIVVAFGQILPKEILDIPKYGCINLHASLLPKYRGAAPINWAVINGENKTGNTTMLMDSGLDTGDILLKSEYNITEDMTAGDVHDILMKDGAELLIKTINGIVEGKITPKKQDNSESSYAPMISKEIAKIDWNLKANDIKNLIRGLNPYPVAFTQYKDKIMKVYKSTVINKKANYKPGYILKVSKEGIEVASGEGILCIKVIQFPGGKPMSVEEYINGNTIEEGVILS
ncbi:methionyl-tRNA formyltransferase [Clostridium sp. USBA 49]|jgi:methionyl-tRNA formyltransferase|uniref:methionyl-tRNA formyltransferase n=1 Tax=Clostridium sp. USBA 49 TaxID=1881060 RepID=UPI00099903C2|nr:methionyl-tRNA formyltransferase [Clostridium sp. USBA 49]SKA76202.1 methionyl-tRNA formyltransferase [Clostridium sp. USBA 49]